MKALSLLVVVLLAAYVAAQPTQLTYQIGEYHYLDIPLKHTPKRLRPSMMRSAEPKASSSSSRRCIFLLLLPLRT
jgi:hypothetical protein